MIYHCADCFVFPSVHEGLPFALMEAMASGLPIICSRIRGNVDLIDAPQGGILCDTFSCEQFCTALEQIRTVDQNSIAEYNSSKLESFCFENTKRIIMSILIS